MQEVGGGYCTVHPGSSQTSLIWIHWNSFKKSDETLVRQNGRARHSWVRIFAILAAQRRWQMSWLEVWMRQYWGWWALRGTRYEAAVPVQDNWIPFFMHQWLHVYTRRLKPVIVSRFYKAIPDPEASNLLMFSILVYYTVSIFLVFMIEYNSVLQSKTQSLQGFKDPSLWRQTSKSQMGQKWTHVVSMLCIRYDPLYPNRFDQLWLTPAKDRKIKRKRLKCFVSFPGWKSVSTKKDG